MQFQAPVKLLLTPKEAAETLGIGVSLLYILLSRKRILSVKVGRCRRIPVTELEAFVQAEVEAERGY